MCLAAALQRVIEMNGNLSVLAAGLGLIAGLLIGILRTLVSIERMMLEERK